ncbi:prepilin-type N-terminal cleavage/methylation domain-containing protein [candidate division WWE3 bacterium]|uniref:Prepilin-type N-terminal cleavage/methylation domain-containing protein n=1 Tax=candidate division WWE3 bacterium TaxID=2053526 RepID=A0A7X9HSL3_UNCKA|nr:prepilin-type N-terminal cleavage/methylation domain-containing protein [candidate division WWE3 bacterium]
MKKLNKNNGSETGFTLIELLIVIVIIGILAGVLIAVVNPYRQQNRARNATIKASLTKVAFGINTARASLGRLPSSSELAVELDNVTPNADCTGADELDCRFTLSGTSLPSTCDAGLIAGDTETGSKCSMAISTTNAGSLVNGAFRITAKQFKINPADVGAVFVFDSTRGLWSCPSDVNYSTVDLASSCTEVTE